MFAKQFIDVLGNKLPALEQNILKFRAMQMLLVIFYAEELRRKVLDLIQSTDHWKARMQDDALSPFVERIPKGTKNPLKKALNVLVQDQAISASDKAEIVRLIDYRNVIAHEMHNILADISSDHYARAFASNKSTKYDYDAVERLQYHLKMLGGLYHTHHYITEINLNTVLFDSAEKTFLAEIKRLKRKVERLLMLRQMDIKKLNLELSLAGTEFEQRLYPRHPLNRYDNGRLTKRGVEICYRLFDDGKSALAVAHLIGLSLISARKQYRAWLKLGALERTKIDVNLLTDRKFYRRHDDD